MKDEKGNLPLAKVKMYKGVSVLKAPSKNMMKRVRKYLNISDRLRTVVNLVLIRVLNSFYNIYKNQHIVAPLLFYFIYFV